MTRVKYIEAGGPQSESTIQALLDQMAAEHFELLQIIPNIDDRRGNPGVTAGLDMFFKQTSAASTSQAA